MDMVFRALAIYLFLVVVFKVAGRRALLQMTSFDLILLLIISEATQQALLGQDFSVTGAMITITTLVVVDIIFGLMKKYFSPVENILDGTPVILVENGVPWRINSKSRCLCDDILVSARQNNGITEISQIKYAILERNGHISIIPFEK
jgi:uncharacterized membrane protein YcaP (DUF421 family)